MPPRTSDAAVFAARGLSLSCGLAIQWLLSERLLEVRHGLAAHSCLLVIYLAFEIIRTNARQPGPLLVSPAVTASIVGFALPFGVTNAIYFIPHEVFGRAGRIDVTPAMNNLMWLVLLAACSMWLGYDSGVARRLGRRIARSRFLAQAFSPIARVNRPMLVACLGLSFAARAFEAEQGILGYGDSDQLVTLAPYREYLTVIDLLGRWALVALALEYYSVDRPTTSQRVLLWGMLAYEISLGLLTGFKSAVLVPIGVVALACATQQGRLPRWTAPAIIGALVAAYLLVQPYRALFGEGAGQRGLLGVGATMLRAQREVVDDGDIPISLQILSRINLTNVASLGVDYQSSSTPLPGHSPDFLSDILLAPLYALVPRLLWDAKPLHDSGQWYTTYIVGVDAISSTAMSGVTSLNFAGGVLAVISGFFMIGGLHRSLLDGLRAFGAGGWLVLLGVLQSISSFEGAFGPQVSGILRMLPILLCAQYVLFRGPRGSLQDAHVQTASASRRSFGSATRVPRPV